MSEVLAEFGYRVREARTRKGWLLEDVARQAFANPDRKGYVSQIENGKIRISPRTVGNLARVLNLPESVTAPMLRQHLPPEDEEASVDRDAERLLRTTKADASVAPASEALLISLAYEFARGSHNDLMTAYNGLKAALSDAADLRARGLLPQNTSDQVQTLMLRLADLNDRGLREEAAAEVDTALADLDARHAAHKSALLDIGIRQDRIRNNPASAAARVLAQLRSVAHPGGLFNATHAAWQEWHDRGYDKGIGFDLHVALHLARANLDRANKGPQRGQALFDLGRTLRHLGEREGLNRWLIEAIKTFREMLAQSPRKRDPMNWATSKNSLGNALHTLGEREGSTERLEQAVQAFRDALLEWTRDRVPLDWAGTQNNLGNALATLGNREGSTERLEQAVQAFRDALLEQTRDRVPLDWTATQNNLGNALQTLGARETSTDRLEQAVQAYRDAMLERTRDRVPLNWAMTQNNLGNVLTTLGAREASTERLEQAVQAYRDALLERTRDRVPLGWATTQNNLGNALRALGELEGSTDRLEQAVQAHRDALLEWTRDRVPLDWAGTQNNLGNALRALGAREASTERLEQAVQAFRDALLEWTRDRVPLYWAASWGNMGEALTLLADRADDLAMARQALVQLQEAEAVLRQGGHQPFATYSADRIPRAQTVIDRLSPAP